MMKGRIALRVRRSAIVFTMIGVTVPSFGVEREYVDRARLTESEEALVLKMARNRGIEEVAKIRTYNMFPTPFRGIAVHGPDQIEGREVSHRVLSVSYRKWLEPGANPWKDDLLMGDFWAGRAKVVKKTILRHGKDEFRIATPRGISVEVCESVLAHLLDGRYRLGPAVEEKMMDGVDWLKPLHFGKWKDLISAGYGHKNKGSGFFDLQIKVVGKELTIEQVFQAIP
tara:strand:+ start:115 stop:795 length:681 start_codon:yes stop_codon:yes gene_type:complete